MHYLLFTESFAAKLDYEVEQGTLRTELAHYADLAHTWRHLFDLSLVDGHDILVIADLAPDLHLINE